MLVDRVPTKDNIADLPSREQYKLLELMGTVRVEPFLDSMFWDEKAWDTLQLESALRKS